MLDQKTESLVGRTIARADLRIKSFIRDAETRLKNARMTGAGLVSVPLLEPYHVLCCTQAPACQGIRLWPLVMLNPAWQYVL